MRHAFFIALLLAAPVFTERPLVAGMRRGDALAEAKKHLAHQDFRNAALVLEEALPDVKAAEKGELVSLLRQAYRNLITQAEAAGKTDDAALYRDNLAILGEDAAPASPTTPNAKPSATRDAKPVPASESTAVARPSTTPNSPKQERSQSLAPDRELERPEPARAAPSGSTARPDPLGRTRQAFRAQHGSAS